MSLPRNAIFDFRTSNEFLKRENSLLKFALDHQIPAKSSTISNIAARLVSTNKNLDAYVSARREVAALKRQAKSDEILIALAEFDRRREQVLDKILQRYQSIVEDIEAKKKDEEHEAGEVIRRILEAGSRITSRNQSDEIASIEKEMAKFMTEREPSPPPSRSEESSEKPVKSARRTQFKNISSAEELNFDFPIPFRKLEEDPLCPFAIRATQCREEETAQQGQFKNISSAEDPKFEIPISWKKLEEGQSCPFAVHEKMALEEEKHILLETTRRNLPGTWILQNPAEVDCIDLEMNHSELEDYKSPIQFEYDRPSKSFIAYQSSGGDLKIMDFFGLEKMFCDGQNDVILSAMVPYRRKRWTLRQGELIIHTYERCGGQLVTRRYKKEDDSLGTLRPYID